MSNDTFVIDLGNEDNPLDDARRDVSLVITEIMMGMAGVADMSDQEASDLLVQMEEMAAILLDELNAEVVSVDGNIVTLTVDISEPAS
ncbi:MAG: hypothetical protein ACO395_06710 [Pontimonas sp.]